MLKALAVVLSLAASDEPLACGPHVIVTIKESSPDLVIVKNASAPGWSIKSLDIDLTPSSGGVYVDYGIGGEGSPHSTARTGKAQLTKFSGASAGSRELAMQFSGFSSPETFYVHLDFDNDRETREFGRDYIDPFEVSGATFSAKLLHETGSETALTGTIGPDGIGVIGGGGCV